MLDVEKGELVRALTAMGRVRREVHCDEITEVEFYDLCENKMMIEKALKFATQAHEGQLRKYTGEPYIVHPIAVSNIVESVTDDKDMIVAALLHDTVEDTDVTLEMVEENFGARVATFVENLTDISTLDQGNRATRKKIDLEHTAKATPEAKTIKLADVIHNTGSITKYDKKFSAVYMKEKKALLEVLSEGDKTLFKKAQRLISNYYKNE